VDGHESAQYDGLSALIFSPDGKRVAYVAIKGQKQMVVVDSQEGTEYDGILGAIAFSPNGQRVAFSAMRGKKKLVVVDGRESPPEYDEIGEGSLVFSPDGKRIAYTAARGNKWSVLLNNQESGAYDLILKGPVFPGATGAQFFSFTSQATLPEYLVAKAGSLYRLTYVSAH